MSVFLLALSAVTCLACLIVTIWLARRAAHVAELPGARLRSIESRLASLENSGSDLLQLITDMANSQKMQRVRAASKHSSSDRRGDGLPDPHTDPDGWRKAMNLRIAQSRLGNVSTN